MDKNILSIFIFLILVGVLTAIIAYCLGKKRGFQNGIDKGFDHNINLVKELKKANSFATDLRKQETQAKEDTRPKEEIN